MLLLEHHYQFGGLATWFTRRGGHIFDISLHGFPSGMIKSCRKYWTREIADAIAREIQLGRLKPGQRLPTQRDLAGQLGVTLTTVTRAYAEADIARCSRSWSGCSPMRGRNRV